MDLHHPDSNRGSGSNSQKRMLSVSAEKTTSQETVRGKPTPSALLFGSPNPARTGDAPAKAGTQCTMGEKAVPHSAAADESKLQMGPILPSPAEEGTVNVSQMEESDSDEELEESTAEQLKAALEAFDKNTEIVTVSNEERQRVQSLLSDDKSDIVPLPYKLRITVKPSVQLQTGQTPQGRMAKKNKIDPTNPMFGKDLERLLIQAAVHDPAAPYEFWQVGKIRMINGIPNTGTFYIKFSHRKYISRVLSAKLTKFKGDYNLSFTEDKEEKPFDGAQSFHCKFIRDFGIASDVTIPKQDYIRSLVRGKMDVESFKGIRKGRTHKTDGSGIKFHDHYEIYFDPAMTANHGIQELDPSKVINLMDEYSVCIPVPKYNILEPPSYVAYKDSTGFIHKRDLTKSGDWCPYCWGKSHEKGFKCIYYNFCRRCLAFNPRDKKYKDLSLYKHLCNYGIHDMPRQNKVMATNDNVIPPQKMTSERIARLEEQQSQVTEMAKLAEADMAKRLKKKRLRAQAQTKKKKSRDFQG